LHQDPDILILNEAENSLFLFLLCNFKKRKRKF